MTQKRSIILDRVYKRLDNAVTGLWNPSYWNLGADSAGVPKRIWKGIGKRKYPPQDYPTVILLYDTSRITRPKPRTYRKILPVGIEVWDKVYEKSHEEVLEIGEQILERVMTAIELDERFSDTDNITGTIIPNTEILMDQGYLATDENIYEAGDGIVYVSITYEFDYTELFLGVRSNY